MDSGDELASFMAGEDIDDLDHLGLNSDDSSGQDPLKSHHPLREQDRFLPIANITKIMKKAIPDNGKIAKDARECVQECVSEFISFITSEASERCHMEKRKTINGEDILFAMCTLGFDFYVEPLKLYLQKYRDHTKTEKAHDLQGFEIQNYAATGGETSAGGTLHQAADGNIIYFQDTTNRQY